MMIIRLATSFGFIQCLFAGAAFASPAPIPEPASMVLLAVGAGGVAAVRALRRRK